MSRDRYLYPAFFYFEPDGISIEFPDLPGCLPCAHTDEEAFQNAKEAMGLHLYGMEQDGEVIPQPTPIHQLHPDDGAVIVMVDVFMPPIRERVKNKVVKKTLTIPAWINALAQEQHINFSQVLCEGLKQKLNIP